MPTLLRKLISSRAATLPDPAPCRTSLIIRSWAVFLALGLCLAIPVHADGISTLDILIVQSEDGGPYEEFSAALRGMLSGSSSKISIVNADQPLRDADLVIAVGMGAAAKVAASNAYAVLDVLLPRAGYLKLQDENPRRANMRGHTAIYLDQPASRQAALLALILPDKHQVGVMYSTTPPEMPRLKRELSDHGLSLNTQIISPTLPLHEALHTLLQNSDVLLALPDPAVYNSSTIRNILLSTYRSNVPLVGFSPAYVKAGALYALYSTPTQIAAQAATLVKHFIQTRTLPSAQYPYEFEIQINEQVARSLGISTKNPAALHDEIKSVGEDTP